MAAQIIPFPIQPSNNNDLRILPIVHRLPDGCLAVPVTNNRCAPLLQAGDFVVVDPSDCRPDHEEMFAIRWSSGDIGVVSAWYARVAPGDPWHGQFFVSGTSSQTIRRVDGSAIAPPLRWSDGPYTEAALSKKLIGRVVGVYQPAYVEPMRLAA